MYTYVNACRYKTSQNQPTIAKQPGKTIKHLVKFMTRHIFDNY